MASFAFLAALFVLGLAVGSFLNVVALRYNPDAGLFSGGWRTGRSHCPHCKKQLGVYELIPIISFVLQRGTCRDCRHALSFQYPLVEFLTGVLFVALHMTLAEHYGVYQAMLLGNATGWYYALLALWCAAGAIVLLITLIDLRLSIIPDELNVGIAVLGIAVAGILAAKGLFDPLQSSFLGHYAALFGFRDSIWTNRLIGAGIGGALFAFIVFITRGRGMGLGDVKLAVALGILFGWPDAILGLLLAFVIGAVVGLVLIAQKKKAMKDGIPFGPFIVLGAVIVLFWGEAIMRGYFSLFPLS